MCKPFMLDPLAKGGLAITIQDVGLAYGTIGIIALLVGGILGGIFSSRVGLKKAIWIMAACMTPPCLTFVYLSVCQPTNLFLISTSI